MSNEIQLAKPKLQGTEKSHLRKVLDGNQWSRGEETKRFEEELGKRVETDHVVATSSGTAALHMCFEVVKRRRGHTTEKRVVLVPAYTFPATARAVEMAGMEPVYVDCEPYGWNMDFHKMKEAYEKHGNAVKAICPAHLYGIPINLPRWRSFAVEEDLFLIHDSCESLGSRKNGIPIGSVADDPVSAENPKEMWTFSFYPNKQFTTGEGGAITANEGCAKDLKMLRNHGRMNGNYRMRGYNYRMSEFQAAVGIAQLQNFHQRVQRRKHLAQQYQNMIHARNCPAKTYTRRYKESVNWMTFPVEVPWIHNVQIKEHMEDNGIEVGTYFNVVPGLTMYQNRRICDFPVAREKAEHTVCLPFHEDMNDQKIATVIQKLNEVIK